MKNEARIQEDIEKYYEAEDQKDHVGKTNLKKIEERIFSKNARNFDELVIKTKLALHILDKNDNTHSSSSKEKIFRNILHDIMVTYAQQKLKNCGSYGVNAPVNYYKIFYSSG